MNPCVKLLLLLLGTFLALYTALGRLIYGGVYWGKLKYWNDGNSAAAHLWLIALLQWIFGLCLPIGSFIVNCMIIHSTRSSYCNPKNVNFPDFIISEIQRKYPNFPSQEYFDERCSTPRKFFISFLVCGLVGSILVSVLKCCGSDKSDSENQQHDLFYDKEID